MTKTRHQTFVEELHRQLTYEAVQKSDSSDKHGVSNDSDRLGRENIMKDIERKFDELFGNLDDDD